MYDSPTRMEPLFPTSRSEQLAELAVELVGQSAALGSQFRSPTRATIAGLLRQVNSYYSNLIEGHHTPPLDIERAMKQEYATSRQNVCSSSRAKRISRFRI